MAQTRTESRQDARTQVRSQGQRTRSANGSRTGAARTRSKAKPKRFFDYSLLAVIIFLCVFGLIMVYSSSSYTAELKTGNSMYYFNRQGIILAGSFVVMLIVSRLDYHKYCKLALVAWIAAMVLMALTNFSPLGISLNGEKRWLGITESLSFQPAEFVKIALIVSMAAMINRIGRKIDTPRGILFALVVSLPLFGMVVIHNLSTGLIIAGIDFIRCCVGSKNQGS